MEQHLSHAVASPTVTLQSGRIAVGGDAESRNDGPTRRDASLAIENGAPASSPDSEPEQPMFIRQPRLQIKYARDPTPDFSGSFIGLRSRTPGADHETQTKGGQRG